MKEHVSISDLSEFLSLLNIYGNVPKPAKGSQARPCGESSANSLTSVAEQWLKVLGRIRWRRAAFAVILGSILSYAVLNTASSTQETVRLSPPQLRTRVGKAAGPGSLIFLVGLQGSQKQWEPVIHPASRKGGKPTP